MHGRHHKWTGWQDVDPTTAALVPRELGTLERVLVNVCWRFWIPLFSVLYRSQQLLELAAASRALSEVATIGGSSR